MGYRAVFTMVLMHAFWILIIILVKATLDADLVCRLSLRSGPATHPATRDLERSGTNPQMRLFLDFFGFFWILLNYFWICSRYFTRKHNPYLPSASALLQILDRSQCLFLHMIDTDITLPPNYMKLDLARSSDSAAARAMILTFPPPLTHPRL